MDYMPDINYTIILPELVTLSGAILIILLDMFLPDRRKHWLAYLALGTVAATAACALLWKGHGTEFTFSGSFMLDFYALFFKIIFYMALGLTILMSIDYLFHARINHGEYYSLLLFSNLGLMVIVSSADMLTLYLGVELTAISFAALVGFMKGNPKSNEAALKYFILSIFASGVFLYGVSLIYGVTGSFRIHQIAAALAHNGSHLNPAVTTGLLLIVLGFGFKVAYVPFHMWVPDVYEGSPTSVAAYLSLGPKAAGLAAMFRVFLIAAAPLKIEWSSTVYFIAVLTMTLGNIMALTQNSIKRLLGYSGIAHVGYLLAGMACSLENPHSSISSIVYYLFVYTFFSLGTFAILILLYDQDKLLDKVEDFNGLSRTAPLPALTMAVFLLSLAGIPPTAGFMGKYLIFSAIVESRMYVLAVIAVLNSAIALYYYMKIIAAMYVNEPDGAPAAVSSVSIEAALMVMMAFSVLGGIFPGPILTLAYRTARALI